MSFLLFFFAAAAKAGASCSPTGGNLLNFPHWYEYLGGQYDGGNPPKCVPVVTGINDVWLIVAAIIEILLRIAAIAAVIMIIYGGVEYITSQGGDSASKARSTIIDALIGLAIAVMASVIIAYIAKSIT